MSTFDPTADLGRLRGIDLPVAPDAKKLWPRVLMLTWGLLGFFLLDGLSRLFMDYWFFESLGQLDVFWTNTLAKGQIWLGLAVGFALATTLPALALKLPRHQTRRMLSFGLQLGIVVGYIGAGNYRKLLLFGSDKPFGWVEPYFNHEASFYVFDLPFIWVLFRWAFEIAGVALLAALLASWLRHRNGNPVNTAPEGAGLLARFLAIAAVPAVYVAMTILDLVVVVGLWYSRYELLFKNNRDSSVWTGPEFIDVNGLLSHVNAVYFNMFVTFAQLVTFILLLRRAKASGFRVSDAAERRRLTVLIVGLAILDASDFLVFQNAVALRDTVAVGPQEPVIQLPYIQRHLDATRFAYGFDQFERIEWTPTASNAPRPSVEELLAHPAIKNVPLWPGYVSRLERLVDPQHADRILLTEGDTMVYGPTMEVFHQQQKLRAYYEFIDMDTVRYFQDGEPVVYASGVRELPLMEPKPWLSYFGQRFWLFTHGYGLAMAPVSQKDIEGGPIFASSGVPSRVTAPNLTVANERVYYGQGSGSMGYSNLDGVEEFDYPTDQGRATYLYPEEVEVGVNVDSFLKRLIIGWNSREPWKVLFSSLITDDTRVHYFRTPMERVTKLAPFLYWDTNPNAVTDGENIVWMANGMATTNRFPNAWPEDLGDKAEERAVTPYPEREVNYVRDSVKATVNAATGDVEMYVQTEDPIMEAWQDVYPSLFRPIDEMPARQREQVQYPIQLMHLLFDDIFMVYHQEDAIQFFNAEDMWDDADEVLGPILDTGGAITFSTEPAFWVAKPGDGLPAARGGSAEGQFALSMMFTNEGQALNVRGFATVYMDGPDYGRVIVLEVPKGYFVPGTAQADAAIDQDVFVAQQIGLWNRQGIEVIRGHTTPLIVENEIIYVEPLFIRSQQNPGPQLKRILVVYRGEVGMGRTIEEALRAAVEGINPAPPSLQ